MISSFSAAALLLAAVTIAAPAEPAVCTRVVDGDTFIATLPDGTAQRIRLQGIDAFELRHTGGPEAKAHLEKLILGRTVELTGTKHDRYRRRLCTITCGRVDIQKALLSSGHAWPWYPPRQRRAMIAAATAGATRAAAAWPAGFFSLRII